MDRANIPKKKPLKIFEFAVPQIQKSNLDWSDNNQGVTIGNRNIQANHGDYWVFTWIWFDSDCSRKNETTHHFSFRQKQVIEPRQSSQRPETFFLQLCIYFQIIFFSKKRFIWSVFVSFLEEMWFHQVFELEDSKYGQKVLDWFVLKIFLYLRVIIPDSQLKGKISQIIFVVTIIGCQIICVLSIF